MFPAGRRLFEDGGHASHFWLIQSGHVFLDLHVPGQGRIKIESIGMGELLGWSWLFPPNSGPSAPWPPLRWRPSS
jgi:hypothetical protein